MKRQYETPMAYVELFTPNQFAGNCQPGVSEKDLSPQSVDCWYNSHPGSYYYTVSNFSSSCAAGGEKQTNGCSTQGTTLTLLTNLCQVDFSGGGYGSGNGVDVVTSSIYTKKNNFNRYCSGYSYDYYVNSKPMYKWDNGSNGYHYALATDVIPGQTTDNLGRPLYFNS